MANTRTSQTHEENQIIVTEVREGSIDLILVGKTPLVINRLSEKAKRELLMPKGKKTAADKANSLKHNPVEEFRASAYKLSDAAALTYLALPSTAPKRAMASAALDIPGTKKAQIGRLTYVAGELCCVYGLPKLFTRIVRSADMNKTPDVRTRCIVPEWAMKVRITFVVPILNATTVINLLAAAGLYIGIGDGRPEKGALNYGQFTVLPWTRAEEVKHILKIGRKEQMAAMERADPYDEETAELLTWFKQEIQVRGKTAMATAAA